MRKMFTIFGVAAAAGWGFLLLAPSAPAATSKPFERGTWHWTGSGDSHPFGSAAVVGDAERESEVLDIYRRWNVVRIYTSYSGDRLRNEANAIAAWNAALHRDGRTSFLLLSTTGWIFEDQRDDLRQRLREFLIEFNAGRSDPHERFRGLHFDVEPHILAEWKMASPERKRKMLFLLRDMYADARSFLDANGAGEIPIYAALPVWIERLPTELGGRGSIGWESVQQRNDWFSEVGRHIDAISLMAFETSHVRTILNNYAWEEENFPGKVIIALRANLGQEWETIDEMLEAMTEVEKTTGKGIDLQPFRRFAEKAGHLSPPEFSTAKPEN